MLCKKNNIYYIDVYCDKNHDTIPKKGWLHGCFNCEQITAKTIQYNIVKKNKKIYIPQIFLCGSCKKILQKDKEKNKDFFILCDHFLNVNYSSLFPSRTKSPATPFSII